jgi:hypothetical protein
MSQNGELRRSDSDGSIDSNISDDGLSSSMSKPDIPHGVLEQEILGCVQSGDVSRFQSLCKRAKGSAVLQAIIRYSHANKPLVGSDEQKSSAKTNVAPVFGYDAEIAQVATELLGATISPLNYIQIACLIGEVDIAMALLNFVHSRTIPSQKLLLMELISKVWGENNTLLHLAAFQGMNDLVSKLLEYGANPDKVNDKGYKPVDCAEDLDTLQVFRSINQGKSSLKSQFSSRM